MSRWSDARRVTGALAGVAALVPVTVAAQDDWTQRKCALYADAWTYLAGEGVPDGVSDRFVAAHDAFLASGCRDRGQVCPQSDAERGLADMLSLMAVAEGMAGSFLPFGCPDDAP
jgi:hypothetical protein